MSNETGITERKISTPNILLKVEKFSKDTRKVTDVFYFLKTFWKLEIKYDELPTNDSFVTMIVHEAPPNYPMLPFSVDCGLLTDGKIVFEQKGKPVTIEDIITKRGGRFDIWRCKLSAVFRETKMIAGSTLRYLCRVNIEDGWEDSPELYEERIPFGMPSCINSLTADLKNLLDTSTMTDVVLKCGEKSFSVHKCILSCRSPVFKAMFQNDFKESRKGVVDIIDVNPTVFQKFINYVYTGDIDKTEEGFDSVCDLLKVADKYCIQSLKERCLSFIKENLNPFYACDILVMPAFNGYYDFKEYVVNYLANRRDFLLSEDWMLFTKENTNIALHVLLGYVRISELKRNLRDKK